MLCSADCRHYVQSCCPGGWQRDGGGCRDPDGVPGCDMGAVATDYLAVTGVCGVTGVETIGIGCTASFAAASLAVIIAVGAPSNGAYSSVAGQQPDDWWDSYIHVPGVGR